MDYSTSSSDSSSEDDLHRQFALHEAIDAKSLEVLEELLSRAAERTDAEKEMAVEMTEDTVETNSEINETDQFEQSPLHLAILAGWAPGVKALLEAGADPETCEGSPPLHIAVCASAQPGQIEAGLECAQLLLQHGARPLERDDNERTPLHWAGYYGLCHLGECLLRAAESANGEDEVSPDQLVLAKDKQGNTALHLAARAGHVGFVELLMRQGAGWDPRKAVSACNRAGQSPLHFAAAMGCAESCVAILRAAPEAALLSDHRRRSPAAWAARRGHPTLAAWLKEPNCGNPLFTQSQLPTYIFCPKLCFEHKTFPEPLERGREPPPENVLRLHVLTDAGQGILRSTLFKRLAWDESSPPVTMADLLRIHEWNYVLSIKEFCQKLESEAIPIGHLDGDTAVSSRTYDAALAAAGAVCRGVDAIMEGRARNAFCAVRPPGHHAGPTGVVKSGKDNSEGSHGFCIFNNVAIGASYAMNVYRHRGVKRVAILDFDVHHGNGTQACVVNAIPTVVKCPLQTPFGSGVQLFPTYKPWYSDEDVENLFFASVQGFGEKRIGMGLVYPGSGDTGDNRPMQPTPEDSDTLPHAMPNGSLAPSDNHKKESGIKQENSNDHFVEDPSHEFETQKSADSVPKQAPRIVNVGIYGPDVARWRRAWRDKILPALVNFKPDIIFVSAGFDAHRKDEINFRYIGIAEKEFEWLTEQIVMVANKCCEGRIVSVLEGGYRIQGGVVSAFSRSVAAHVKALQDPNFQVWDEEDAKAERRREQQKKLAEEERRKLAEAAMEVRCARAMAENDVLTLQESAEPLEPSPGKRRRRGEPVDYQALNRQLEMEEMLVDKPEL